MAQVMARGGEDVRLWAREPEVVAAVNDTHANPLFLPDVALDPRIVATADMAALADMRPDATAFAARAKVFRIPAASSQAVSASLLRPRIGLSGVESTVTPACCVLEYSSR